MAANHDDTIFAIATPLGEGGIGIVRVSGCKAIECAQAVVQLRSSKRLAALQNRLLVLGDLLDVTPAKDDDTSEPIPQAFDEALVTVMRSPRSYTGEDVVEIHSHGGPLVLHRLCEALLRQGARLADPGEFTKRAFLNGRMDLTQAEAVLDTIRAKTSGALKMAQAQLRGALCNEVDRLRDSIVGLLAEVEAGIDFSDEDLTFIRREELLAGLSDIHAAMVRLAKTGEDSRVLREGITVAIVGRPNVGKSSLLNALLRADRAIVTAMPGTTRDTLEEVLNIRGVPVRLLDTAGLRETDDPAEQEGVRRTRVAMDDAQILVLLVDGSTPLTQDDHSLLIAHRARKRLLVMNKTDLPGMVAPADLVPYVDEASGEPIGMSVKTGCGLDTFRDRLRMAVLRADFEPGETAVVTRLRHQVALRTAQEALIHAIQSVQDRLPPELVALDLRGALEALGEITGAVTTDDILDRIFREFCIGK
jgi:tRNA modification GTPase